MKKIICWIIGHKPKYYETKRERLVFFGETAPQYETVVNCYCERCGLFQSPINGRFIGV